MCHKQPVPPLPLHLLNQRVLFIHLFKFSRHHIPTNSVAPFSALSVFIRLDAAEFIKFFVIRVRPVFEGGVYLKSNLFLANNIMATEHLNLKKKHILVLV